MDIDADQFRNIVKAIGMGEPGYRENAAPQLTTQQGRAVITIARLAVDSDDREDSDETDALDQMIAHVCALAGMTEPPEQDLPRDDEERSEQLEVAAGSLRDNPGGALAYAIAYVMTIADMDIAPVEQRFIDDVAAAVGLDADRAEDLKASVAELLTPGT